MDIATLVVDAGDTLDGMLLSGLTAGFSQRLLMSPRAPQSASQSGLPV